MDRVSSSAVPFVASGMRSVRTVAVIGAGAGGAGAHPVVNGTELALLCGRAGFPTTLEDVLPGNLRRAAATLPAEFAPRFATSIEEAVRDADLVLDTVPDELESKLEILTLLDRMAPPHTLFATPSEVLSIADLASCTYRPGQCFGLRFLSRPPVGSLQVALHYPPACTAATLARMVAFLHALGAVVQAAEDTRALP